MSRGDKIKAFLIGFFAAAWITSMVRTHDDFSQGYEAGAHQVNLYYRATGGEWPSYEWRHEHLNDDLQTFADIEATLGKEETSGQN